MLVLWRVCGYIRTRKEVILGSSLERMFGEMILH